MLSTQITVSQILQMLTQNPNTGVFPLSTSDFPGGVTRVALLAALAAQLGPTNSGNFDLTTGAWNSQVFAPGILLNGGGQIPASPSANMTGTASPLPVMNPVGAAAAGSVLGVITTPSEVQ